MAWSVSASGHWAQEEQILLQRIVDAIEEAPDVVCSVFSFHGNYIQAGSLEDARQKLVELDVTEETSIEEEEDEEVDPEEE